MLLFDVAAGDGPGRFKAVGSDGEVMAAETLRCASGVSSLIVLRIGSLLFMLLLSMGESIRGSGVVPTEESKRIVEAGEFAVDAEDPRWNF